MDEHDWLAEQFEAHRSHLRAVAYRMLGSLAEADDAVQEAWLRLSRADTSGVENLGGWLTTVVARVSPRHAALARRRAARNRWRASLANRIGARERERSRAGGGAGRLGRLRAAGRARHAGARRAARVRAARHVRGAVRRDRAHRRPLPERGQTARQPGRASKVQGDGAAIRAPIRRASERSSTRSSPPHAAVTSTRSLALLDPDIVLDADSAAVGMGSPEEVRGAAAVAGTFSGRALPRRPRSSTAPSGSCGLWANDPRSSGTSRSATARSSTSTCSRPPTASTTST